MSIIVTFIWHSYLNGNGGAGKKLLRIISRYAEQEIVTNRSKDSLSPQNHKTPATASTEASGPLLTSGAGVEHDPITGEKLNKKKGELAFAVWPGACRKKYMRAKLALVTS